MPRIPSLPTTGYLSSLSPSARFLIGFWILFGFLVALGLHGSSIAASNPVWAPEVHSHDTLVGEPRPIRSDEWMVATPLMLSQFAHQPRFPVVNTLIGEGQDMLMYGMHYIPVWHIVSLARPGAWGYFLLGPERGLAWQWWFQVFSCFSVLYLLLEIILQGERLLAAFGAYWYCSSGYIVAWSHWPAYTAFFPALACLAGYYLLRATKPALQVLSGVILGLSLSGFILILYPAWQVPLGYLFLFVFLGLVVRDKLYLSLRRPSRPLLLSLGLALLLTAGLMASFVTTCLPDLKIAAHTLYPGQRISTGGDYSFVMIFKGMFNWKTLYQAPSFLGNECEAASFYYLFPAAFLALCLSRELRTRMGLLEWLLVIYLAGFLFYFMVGIPEFIARLTILRYAKPNRADIATGLASILLCIRVHALAKLPGNDHRAWERRVPWIAAAASGLFFLVHGWTMEIDYGYPPMMLVFLMASFAGLVSYFMLAGRSLAFCGILGIVVLATSIFFNPISNDLAHVYQSELARQVTRLNRQSGGHPLWICYGSRHPGELVTALGGRSIAGTQWPPQMTLWHSLDPDRQYEEAYNRLAHVILFYQKQTDLAAFGNPPAPSWAPEEVDVLYVSICPSHPVLKSLGARYILAMGKSQEAIEPSRFPLIYKSQNGIFSIFEIPR